MSQTPAKTEASPRQERRFSDHPKPLDDNDTSVAGYADTGTADRWASWSLNRARKRAAGPLCHHCAAHPRHPESTLCSGCLEMGAGDVWSGGAA